MMDSPQRDLPGALANPVAAHARNNEHNLDLTGRCTNLGERELVITFPVEIPEETVLFTNLHLGTTVVRGLTRVLAQWPAGELGGYKTLLEFVDLVDSERRKIARELRGPESDQTPGETPTPAHAGDHAPAAPAKGARRPRLRLNLNWHLPPITIGSVIWFLLGVVFYSSLIIGAVALFPQGRAYELMLLHRVEVWFQSVERFWNHFLETH